MGKVKMRGESYSAFPTPFRILTSYMTHAMPRVNFFCIKKYEKKLKFKSVMSFCKAIPKSLGFGCNV